MEQAVGRLDGLDEYRLEKKLELQDRTMHALALLQKIDKIQVLVRILSELNQEWGMTVEELLEDEPDALPSQRSNVADSPRISSPKGGRPPPLPCRVKGCTFKRRYRGGVCNRHRGTVVPALATEKKPAGSRRPSDYCSVDGCRKWRVKNRMCYRHFRESSGTKKIPAGPQNLRDFCVVEGCRKWRVRRGFCRAHLNECRDK